MNLRFLVPFALAASVSAQSVRVSDGMRVDLLGAPDRWVEFNGHRFRYLNTSNPYNLDDFWFMVGTVEGRDNLLGLSRDRADSTIPGTVVVGSGALASVTQPYHGGAFFSLQGKYYANGSGDQDLNFRLRAVLDSSIPTGRLSLTTDQAYPSSERELARFHNTGFVLFYGSIEAQAAGAYIRIHDPGVSHNRLRTANGELQVQNGDGTGFAPVRASAYLTPSSRALKRNVKPYDGGLEAVMALRSSTFDYIGGPNGRIGFIAEEVARVVPSAADSKGTAIDYSALVPILVRAIQEQQAQISALRKQAKVGS